jgi:hypothetical protein
VVQVALVKIKKSRESGKEERMTKRLYRQLVKEWERKNRLYPDHGFSYRPWEKQLRNQIFDCIQHGLRRKCQWAYKAASEWSGIPEATLEAHPNPVKLFESTFG